MLLFTSLWFSDTSAPPPRSNIFFVQLVISVRAAKACVCLIRLVEHAGLMCVVSVFNQRAASCRFDVDGELIKQYLWCLHQLQHFVLPLLAPLRQTAALSVLELKWSCTATSVSPHLGAWSFHGHGHELEFYFKVGHLSSLCEGFQ